MLIHRHSKAVAMRNSVIIILVVPSNLTFNRIMVLYSFVKIRAYLSDPDFTILQKQTRAHLGRSKIADEIEWRASIRLVNKRLPVHTVKERRKKVCAHEHEEKRVVEEYPFVSSAFRLGRTSGITLPRSTPREKHETLCSMYNVYAIKRNINCIVHFYAKLKKITWIRIN